MGLLSHFKNTISIALGLKILEDEGNKIYLFNLYDEKGEFLTCFRDFTNNLNQVRSTVKSKERCTVHNIETAIHHKLYYVHAMDHNGKTRKFKMERL